MTNHEPIEAPFIRQTPSKYAFILNPHSGNGRAARQWARLDPEIARLVGEYTVFQTKHAGHATELTRQALHEGYDRIVSAGGDGTHYEVVNGFFDGCDPIKRTGNKPFAIWAERMRFDPPLVMIQHRNGFVSPHIPNSNCSSPCARRQ